jgi:hypothetical protein
MSPKSTSVKDRILHNQTAGNVSQHELNYFRACVESAQHIVCDDVARMLYDKEVRDSTDLIPFLDTRIKPQFPEMFMEYRIPTSFGPSVKKSLLRTSNETQWCRELEQVFRMLRRVGVLTTMCSGTMPPREFDQDFVSVRMYIETSETFVLLTQTCHIPLVDDCRMSMDLMFQLPNGQAVTSDTRTESTLMAQLIRPALAYLAASAENVAQMLQAANN